MKKQVIVIHGGNSYPTYEAYIEALKSREINAERLRFSGWKKQLQKDLGGDYEVILPEMPCAGNAKFLEWKIWFDKIVPLLNDEIILVGHSQGGIFLAKYLSENTFPKKIIATFMVSASFDERDTDEFLGDFNLSNNLEKFAKQGGKIFLIHSEDDPVVPFVDLDKYAKLLPNAEKIIFKNNGHFIQEHFPELVEKIKSL